jgi:hypothetical protein
MHSKKEDFIFLECSDKTFDKTEREKAPIPFVKLPGRKRGRRDIDDGNSYPTRLNFVK